MKYFVARMERSEIRDCRFREMESRIALRSIRATVNCNNRKIT